MEVKQQPMLPGAAPPAAEKPVVEPEAETEAAPTQAVATTAQPAAAAAPAAEVKPKDDLKVMIQFLRAGHFILGVGRADCDPIFEGMDGDLAFALQQIPAFVEKAKTKWAASPRNQKAPEPPPPPPRATTSSPGKALPPAKPKVQPSFF